VNEREYRRLRQQIEDDAKRKIDALDMVWQMVQGASNGHSARSDAPIKRGTIDNLIRRVIPLIEGTFTPRTVMALLQQQPHTGVDLNRSSVSSALKRLADENVITLVEGGKGKRPSIYETKANDSKPQDAMGDLGVSGPPTESPDDERLFDMPFEEPLRDDDAS
jgi:hypothetical protein